MNYITIYKKIYKFYNLISFKKKIYIYIYKFSLKSRFLDFFIR